VSDKAVAIVGATGAVGRTMLSILEERDFGVSDLRMFASSRSAGEKVETRWGEVLVEKLADADPSGIDIALFSAGGARSQEFAPQFVDSGATVVDNSSAFRMEPDVPLVVVGVNDDHLAGHRGIVANPNCTTMTLMIAAGPLHSALGLRSMVASSYQSVSGSGQAAVDELMGQVDALRGNLGGLMKGSWEDPGSVVYPRPIAFNVLPFAGSEATSGYTDEELKLVNESRKILSLADLAVEPTCVRVPVAVGHGISASLRFATSVSPEAATQILNNAPGIEVWTDKVPTSLDATGLDDVLAGRIRPTLGEPGGLNLWVVGDNLRKGAALNAVQIAELL
jgi:aspartate-semialdehyde dehydrogenase